MRRPQPFTASGRLRSIRFAVAGILVMLKTQHNARVHLAATVAVFFAGLFFGVTASEWSLLVVVMVLVWMAEALNTAFEFLCDVVSPEYNPMVRKAKDIAAAAVLICAAGAVVVGLLVFVPYMRA